MNRSERHLWEGGLTRAMGWAWHQAGRAAWLGRHAAEVRTALALATSQGYIPRRQAAPARALLDRIVATLWRVTHPKR
ncbi:MAG: hypothetical protein WBP56_14915 [Polyangia bacterium]|jgi:hypothetical protein